ncbi:Hypothetical predicted protein [Octopus vulgaris]|uniref:Uncharacterized protein n=1 Tax=Octopus vulgaris TaxID=6645 RepID=A0AA36FC47_OCTVU|nr:Hypothetical predicted protein [Octopus vulgaris]
MFSHDARLQFTLDSALCCQTISLFGAQAIGASDSKTAELFNVSRDTESKILLAFQDGGKNNPGEYVPTVAQIAR